MSGTTSPQTPRINGDEDRMERWFAAQAKIHAWNDFVEKLDASIERLPEDARAWMHTATGCFPQFVRERILRELIDHFEALVDDLVSKGGTEQHAQQQALRQLGSARSTRRKYQKEYLTTDERTLCHRLQLRRSGDIKHPELSWFGIVVRVAIFTLAAAFAINATWICLSSLFASLPPSPVVDNVISFWLSPLDWYANKMAQLRMYGPDVPIITSIVSCQIAEFFLPSVLGVLSCARTGGDRLRWACGAAVFLFTAILVIDISFVVFLVLIEPFWAIFVCLLPLVWIDEPPNVQKAVRLLRWISKQDEASAT